MVECLASWEPQTQRAVQQAGGPPPHAPGPLPLTSEGSVWKGGLLPGAPPHCCYSTVWRDRSSSHAFSPHLWSFCYLVCLLCYFISVHVLMPRLCRETPRCPLRHEPHIAGLQRALPWVSLAEAVSPSFSWAGVSCHLGGVLAAPKCSWTLQVRPNHGSQDEEMDLGLRPQR